MDRQEEREKQRKFKELLKELASDPHREKMETPEKRLEYQHRFEELYGAPEGQNGFRHFYSDIFRILADMQDHPEEGDGNVLADNIQILLDEYEVEEGRPNVVESLRKLYDHISLDLARMNYIQSAVHSVADGAGSSATDLAEIKGLVESVHHESKSLRDISELVLFSASQAKEQLKKAREDTNDTRSQLEESKKELEKAQSTLKSSEKTLKDAKESLDTATQKIDNSQKEYIAILGIFSAVVLTFIGGMAFSTSVLENIHKSSAYRIVFTVTLIGLVLYNVFYLLFFCIQSLLERTVGQHQKDMLRNGNILLVIILLVTVLSWALGIVENRNHQFSENAALIQTAVVSTVSTRLS